jgi:hypothetical protein
VVVLRRVAYLEFDDDARVERLDSGGGEIRTNLEGEAIAARLD